MGLIKSQNILVGVSNKYIYNATGNFAGTSAAATIGAADTSILLSPTTDASDLTPGDVITVGTLDPFILASIDASSGSLYLGEAVAVTLAGGQTVTQIWRNLGATDGGVDVTGQITKTPQYVDDTPWAVQSVLTKGEAGLVMPLAEILMQNMALAFGDEVASVSVAGGVTSYAVNPTAAREDAYLITGVGPDGNKRTVYVPRGVNQGSVSLKMDKSNKQILALKVDAMYDSTRSYPLKFKDHASNWYYTGW